MATWITHIRIAERLIGKFPFLDGKDFVIGSIAPDSGKINPDGITYVPEKEITHFGRYRDGRDYARLLSLIDDDNSAFFLGYYAHILTDDLWIGNVLLPKKAQYLKEFPDFYHFIMAQRDNWFILDKDFLASYPDNHAWRMFSETEKYDNNFLSFQPVDAFTEHIRKIKDYYSGHLPSDDTTRFLSAHELNGFIAYAVPIVEDKIKEWQKDIK